MQKLSIAEVLAEQPKGHGSLCHTSRNVRKLRTHRLSLTVNVHWTGEMGEGQESLVDTQERGGMKGRSALEDVALESGSPAGAQGWMLREKA